MNLASSELASETPEERRDVVDLEERTWLARHRRGDAGAFPALMAAYRRPVYSYLVRGGVAEADRDDVFQAIFLKIHAAAGSYDPARPKFLFIDEAWALLKNEASARYVAEAFRTYRKLGCAVVAVSQAITDFLSVPGGRTILQNSPTKILLRQERETVSTLKDELKLSPEEVQLVGSVNTVPGVRSEFYLRTSWGGGVLTLYLSPVMYWVATTDFRDTERYRRKLADFAGNQIEAIKALAREDMRRRAL